MDENNEIIEEIKNKENNTVKLGFALYEKIVDVTKEMVQYNFLLTQLIENEGLNNKSSEENKEAIIFNIETFKYHLNNRVKIINLNTNNYIEMMIKKFPYMVKIPIKNGLLTKSLDTSLANITDLCREVSILVKYNTIIENDKICDECGKLGMIKDQLKRVQDILDIRIKKLYDHSTCSEIDVVETNMSCDTVNKENSKVEKNGG